MKFERLCYFFDHKLFNILSFYYKKALYIHIKPHLIYKILRYIAGPLSESFYLKTLFTRRLHFIFLLLLPIQKIMS